MSKVISFSISDKYLEKLRALYPALTDNLAAKQFLTDRLDGSLGSGLDASLDDGLDDRVTTLIESWVDGLLDERLDATVGKLLTSLSERMARLEARLDDSLDGSLDDMERLLKLQQSASIASPLPTGEPSPDEPDRPAIGTLTSESDSSIEGEDAIETVTPEVSPSPPGTDAIGTLPTVETVSTDSSIELDKGAIGPVGMTAMAAVDYLETKKVKVSYASLHRWRDGVSIPNTSPQGRDARKHLILINKLYYPIN